MTNGPIFVTRVNVAKGQDFAMVALGAPAGPLNNGSVENAEVLRVVMSYRTLKQVAALFNRTVEEIEAAEAAQQPSASGESTAFAKPEPQKQRPERKREPSRTTH
jgi:hypothetical protein